MSTHNTTDSLVNDIKRRAAIPISQATFSQQDIVDYLNDELESVLVPLLMSVREEFFVTSTDFSITSSVNTFSIPSDAIGQRLRDVVLVDTSNGDEYLTNLPRLTIEQISSTNGTLNNSTGFYIEGNKVKLYPESGLDGQTIRLYYFKRPGKLVPVNQTGKITVISSNVVSLSSLPGTWTTSSIIDGIASTQPFQNTASNLTISAISGFDITVSDASTLSVGDYIALAGESPIPQIPAEAQQLLVQAAKVEMLDSQGDTDAWKIASVKYKSIKESLLNTITPRVDGQYKKVVSRNTVFNYGAGRGYDR